jgi:Ca-activated chloride channel family protein
MLPILRLLECAIVPLFVAALTAAQFTSGVSLVEVYATVTDARGEPVAGLTAADFHVAEDGEPQAITAFAAGEFPLSVAIALDRSFSMAGARLDLARRAAASFIAALRPDDEVTVIAIGSEIETITPAMPARDAARTPWNTIDAWGATPLYDVARQAIDAVQNRRGRRALLIISDGADRGSETTADDLLAHARRSDVLVYPVVIGKGRSPVLAELAGETGGRSIAVGEPRQLDQALASLARELRMQYLLGYAPARRAPTAPGWHAIDVTVDRASVRVRARDGYFSK